MEAIEHPLKLIPEHDRLFVFDHRFIRQSIRSPTQRRCDESFYKFGIEFATSHLPHDYQSGIVIERRFIELGCQFIISVHNSQDTSTQWYLRRLQVQFGDALECQPLELQNFDQLFGVESSLGNLQSHTISIRHLPQVVVAPNTGLTQRRSPRLLPDNADIVQQTCDFQDIETFYVHQAASEIDGHFGDAVGMGGDPWIVMPDGSAERHNSMVRNRMVLDVRLGKFFFFLSFRFLGVAFQLLRPASDCISTTMLRRIQPLVGLLDEGLKRLGTEDTARNANTRRDMVRGLQPPLDACTDFFRHLDTLVEGRSFHRYAELLAAITRRNASRIDDVLDNAHHILQHRISGRVTMLVIELLEVVHVHHDRDQAKIAIIAICPDSLDLFEQSSAVVGAGQSIAASQLMQNFVLSSNLLLRSLQCIERLH